jgi:alpha-mannosidase
MQDDKIRLTLMTTHAQGAASLEPGQMEVMLDRRTLYDDYRGMGEGIVDSRLTRHRFWLTLEQLDKTNQIVKDTTNSAAAKEYPLPSIFVNQLINSLNYPANIYFLEKWDDNTKLDINKQVLLLNKQFPCDLHLLTLRTQTETDLPLFPSRSAFLVMHRQGYDCKIGGATAISNICGQTTLHNNLFEGINIELIESTSLTGLKTIGKVNSMSHVSIEPMQLKTFNLTFVK